MRIVHLGVVAVAHPHVLGAAVSNGTSVASHLSITHPNFAARMLPRRQCDAMVASFSCMASIALSLMRTAACTPAITVCERPQRHHLHSTETAGSQSVDA
jgi:hypothetical protein